MPDDDFSLSDVSFEKVKFTKEHLMVMIMGIGLFAFIIFAVQELGWWINEMAGAFFLMGILAVFISRMSLDDASKAFVSGMKEMVVAALVVGFARGVQVVLQDGQILDTIIHSAADITYSNITSLLQQAECSSSRQHLTFSFLQVPGRQLLQCL